MEGAAGNALIVVEMELDVLEHPLVSVNVKLNVPAEFTEMVSEVDPLLHKPDELPTSWTLPPWQKTVFPMEEITGAVGNANSEILMIAVSVAVINV